MREPEGELTLRTAYQAELAPSLGRRIDLTAALFLFFIGLTLPLEAAFAPQRADILRRFYQFEVVTCLLAVGAIRVPFLRPHASTIAALMVSMLSALMSWYSVAVAGQAERLAMAQVCLLTSVFVLLPWRWVNQMVAALAALGGWALVMPYLRVHESVAFGTLSITVAATTSVFGSLFLDRYRWNAFVRTALQTEEAEIAAALVGVGQTLHAQLDQPDLLDHLTRLAVETLGCDWSSLFVWDEGRRIYRLGGNTGSKPEIRTELEQVEFPPDSFPLLGVLRPGELFELPDRDRQTLVPRSFLRRWEQASALYATISRRERIVGILVCGRREQTGPFSAKQKRLALGMARAAGIAFENARLINDLQTANRVKSEFVSTMSHELRTPLHVIMGYTDMLEDLEGPARAEAIAKIQATSRELLELIEATLNLNRLESGRDAPNFEAVPLRPLWDELAAEFDALPRRPEVRLRFEPVGGLVLYTDRRKLKIVVKNLISNALKFTPAGEVVARCRREGPDGRLTVRDTGVGIEPEQRPHIFDMFRQADSSDRRSYGGVGLGLYIVRRLVDQLRGEIRVDSEPGIGSIFTVTLPLAEEQVEPVRLAAPGR